MILSRWRKKLRESDDRLQRAVEVRDEAVRQRERVDRLTPRVDAATSRQLQLRTENHIGPLIDSLLRGNE